MPTKAALPSLCYALGLLSIVLVWEALALRVDSALILPPPHLVARRLAALVGTERFLLSLGASFLRLLAGLAVAVPVGLACGLASGLDKRAAAFLRPTLSIVAATPVMAVILIAFLAFGPERTPVFTAFLMVFPVMAHSAAAGVSAVDGGLLEMCAVYRLPLASRLRCLYLPALSPFIAGGLSSALSLSWKVIVAAEVLVQPAAALGTGMQTARAHLETPELFAWTAATVIAAALTDALALLVRRLASRLGARRAARRALREGRLPALPRRDERGEGKGSEARAALSFQDVRFAFGAPAAGENVVFERLSLSFSREANPVMILGPSGCGKTTLLRLAAGLLHPASGSVTLEIEGGEAGAEAGGEASVAFVFQEPRLLPRLSVLENVALPLRREKGEAAALARGRRFLALCGLAEKAAAFPEELSGGQRQRAALARAWAYPAPVILMDEPFQSLDIALRLELMDAVRALLEAESRLLVTVTHDTREAMYLGRRILVLNRLGQLVLDEARDAPLAAREFTGSPALEQRLLAALRGGGPAAA